MSNAPSKNEPVLAAKLQRALWELYRRPDRPAPWHDGGNLPWNRPDFSERMLSEHLDQTHGAASRTHTERTKQIDWMWQHLSLAPNTHLLDVTCGPGLYATALAQRGCTVTGIDFSPASIDYAKRLAQQEDVAARCTFIEQDIREMELPRAKFDGAILLYGQLAVFPRAEARNILKKIALSLKPKAKLCIELLDPQYVDRTESTWWFTDDTGLWGDSPFLNLGERFWDEEERCSTERYTILHLESGECETIHLSDQTYTSAEVTALLHQAGFSTATHHPEWDSLDLYDAREWHIHLAST